MLFKKLRVEVWILSVKVMIQSFDNSVAFIDRHEDIMLAGCWVLYSFSEFLIVSLFLLNSLLCDPCALSIT